MPKGSFLQSEIPGKHERAGEHAEGGKNYGNDSENLFLIRSIERMWGESDGKHRVI